MSMPALTVYTGCIAELIHDDGDFAVMLLGEDVAGGYREEAERMYATSVCEVAIRVALELHHGSL